MSAKKASARIVRRPKSDLKKHQKDWVALVKLINRTGRQMSSGGKLVMIVSVLDLKGNNIAIQTVAGAPHPPTPPGPPMRFVQLMDQ